MIIATDHIDVCCHETDIYNRLLSLDNKHILELGCGNASVTRRIAQDGHDRRITALEVDLIAHEKNLEMTDLANVSFGLGGAQDIPVEDESVDIVLMFKSLHHVPVDLMAPSMLEIRRVLKPGGYAYFSEPVFAGEFNEIMRLFHDEREVRQCAFNTLKHAVNSGQFELVEEIFFNSPRHYADFSEFEDTIIKATHSDHRLDDELYTHVKRKFHAHQGKNGADFLNPMRVDLLRRPHQ